MILLLKLLLIFTLLLSFILLEKKLVLFIDSSLKLLFPELKNLFKPELLLKLILRLLNVLGSKLNDVLNVSFVSNLVKALLEGPALC